MVGDAAAPDGNEPAVFDQWSARKIRPIVVLYVLLVFAGFMVVSIVVFHSVEAVKALAIAAVGAVIATVPGVFEMIAYRATAAGIEKRTIKKNRTAEFKEVFRWDELSHVVPMRHGFAYYKVLDETRPLRRFWKQHISDRFSGEVHVAKQDLARVLEIVRRQGIATS